MRSMHPTQKPLAVALIFGIMGIVVFSVCACEPPGNGTAAPIFTVIPVAKQYPHRGKITALFCDDTTGSYKRDFFEEGKQKIAESFLSAVQPNQDGLTLYVATINYDPVAPENSLDPLSIPAIGGYPPTVTVIPYSTPKNQLNAGAEQATVDAQNNQNATDYNGAVLKINASVKAATTTANTTVGTLKKWNPPEDDRGTSVYGCLYLVKNRLQPTSDIKQLFISSDLENNVTTSLTNDFAQSHSLKDVSVHVIYLPGSDNDNTKRATWCQFFKAAGATATRFDDTATSAKLSDLFNADLTPASAC